MNSNNQQKDNNKSIPVNEGYQPSKDTLRHGYNPEKKQNTNQKTTPPPAKP